MSLIPPRLGRTLVGAAAAAGLLSAAAAGTSASTTATALGADDDVDDVVTTTVTSDPDDTPGALDLDAVAHQVRQLSPPHGAVRVRWTLRTHQRFDPSVLQSRHRRFTVELDTDGERGAERNIRLVMRSGRVVAEVVSNATREVLATLGTDRTDRRSLSFAGYKGLVGARRYFWYSDFHSPASPACGRGNGFPIVCQDSVPDDGWVRLDRPAWPETSR